MKVNVKILILTLHFALLIFNLMLPLEARAGILISRSISSSYLTNGLVGYWTMDGNKVNWATGAVTDSSGFGNTGTITNMATSTGVSSGKLGQALNFDGVDDSINIANTISNIQTVGFWVKATTTKKLIDLNGTASIEVINGTITANNFTATIYVDGIAASTIDTNWHYVTVTTGTGISGSAITIGKIGTGFLNGILDDVRIYNRALSAKEVHQLYLIGK